MKKRLFLIFFFFSGVVSLFAQETVVSGKIIDVQSGDPIPFANVFFPGSEVGTTSDFDGFFKLKISSPVDSLAVSYIGYYKKVKKVVSGKEQVINFQLESTVTNLQEVVIFAGENPAYEVIRKAVKNKNRNNKKSLLAYQYETYNKIEVDLNNLTEKFKNRKIIKKISQIIDSASQIAGDEGQPILPLFISESLSEFYYRSSPKFTKEKILNTRISGVFVEDGNLISQLIGSSFQEYNFYQNWLLILDKDFVSPIADSWKLYYDYDLLDSVYVGDHFCYRLDMRPRRAQDLAFTGTIWITTDTYAIKQIDVGINKSANLNFVEKLKIQQELAPTNEGPWLPLKTRVLIDLAELTNWSSGMLAKFYTSSKNWVINEPQNLKFYDPPIEVAEDSKMQDEAFWITNRHDSLSPTELEIYSMIDTIKNIPVVKSQMEILNILTYGYKDIGKLDIGPIFNSYAFNSVEGHRFGMGLRTNVDFSKKWVIKGALAYGTKDQDFKYKTGISYIISRRPWTRVGVEHNREIEQVGLEAEELENNSIFYNANRFGDLRRPFIQATTRLHFQTEIKKGISQKLVFKNQSFDPLFDFQYYKASTSLESEVKDDFRISEVSLQTRFAKDEVFLQNENERLSVATGKWPVVTVNYTYGVKGLLGGDFDYHKFTLGVRQNVKTGFLGRSQYDLFAGKIVNPLPYPLLKVHIGNETPFFTSAAFNLMNNFEFVSDTYAGLKFQHFFEGFITNSIPLMKKLKWRLVASGNILYGSASEENFNLIPDQNKEGGVIPKFNSLETGKPYIEVGYGIENILKFIRIDAFHRLTYLDNPNVSKFGVKVNFQLIL